MEKDYIFFADTINRVGGAQLYMAAKSCFLTQQGWNVYICYHQDGNIFIKDLQNYSSLQCPYLFKPSYQFLKSKRNNVVNLICDFIPNAANSLVIESHSRTLASWAELIAEKKGNAKHICYDLNECIKIPKPMFDFYKFKYKRHELFGIQPCSIELLFKGTGFELKYGSPCLQAYGASECVSDCESSINTTEFKGLIIGVVGRLEKAYVWESAKTVKDFVDLHSDQDVTLVFIGGSPKEVEIRSQIAELFKGIQNISIYYTGYLYPIPRSLVTSFNVCLASAGAASAISREGVVTISIDPRDLMANGVMGVTTTSSTFSEREKKSILWWLEQVYTHPEEYLVSKTEFIYDFSTHIDAINNSEKVFAYNTSFLNNGSSLNEWFVKFINSYSPINLRNIIASAVRKVRRY